MDNFKVIYKILKHLEAMLDCEETNIEAISADRLGISRTRWEQILIMLDDEKYIKGIVSAKSIANSKRHICEPIEPEITLKGLEYLADNTLMKKAANMAKGIKDIVPGL